MPTHFTCRSTRGHTLSAYKGGLICTQLARGFLEIKVTQCPQACPICLCSTLLDVLDCTRLCSTVLDIARLCLTVLDCGETAAGVAYPQSPGALRDLLPFQETPVGARRRAGTSRIRHRDATSERRGIDLRNLTLEATTRIWAGACHIRSRGVERLVICRQTTSVSAAHTMHCATYCTRVGRSYQHFFRMDSTGVGGEGYEGSTSSTAAVLACFGNCLSPPLAPPPSLSHLINGGYAGDVFERVVQDHPFCLSFPAASPLSLSQTN